VIDEIEKYAVGLAGEGAESLATDDIDEEGQFENEDDWRKARVLGVKMGRAIKDNPEGFLAWYRSLPAEDGN
jgi:hypothetical protein